MTIRDGRALSRSGRRSLRQQEAGEVIDREAQLETVGADLAGVSGRADPGVVDEDIKGIGLAPPGVGEGADVRERGKIGRKERRRPAAFRDRFDDSASPRFRSRPWTRRRAPRGGEPLGDPAPDAVGRAGDEDGLAAEISLRDADASVPPLFAS